jgi:hypothetical protein
MEARKGNNGKFKVPMSKVQIYDEDRMTKTLIASVATVKETRDLAKREMIRQQLKKHQAESRQQTQNLMKKT